MERTPQAILAGRVLRVWLLVSALSVSFAYAMAMMV
jgi:hypothetical protein